MTAEPTEARADEQARVRRGARVQRRLLLIAAFAFPAALAAAMPPNTAFQTALYVLSGAIAMAFALKRMPWARAAYPAFIVPISISILFSLCIVMGTANAAPGDGLSYAGLFALLAPLVTLLAPTRRGLHAALGVLAAIAVAGAVVLAAHMPSFELTPVLVILAAILATSFAIARVIDEARRDGLLLRAELERRATSDDITGVSNRAHINLLAQNEFSRARRYGQPYTCMMIEIEGYETLRASNGEAALVPLVQVFTGYCVVVMRHCDSFGRLAPNRFLALLPETPAAGAQTLANRMCGDLAALDVAFGGAHLHFTVSIGCAEMHPVDRWSGDLLRRAEQGLLDALERGGNCAVFAHVPAAQPIDLSTPPMNDPLGPGE